MDIVLRIIGILWILLTAADVFSLARRFFYHGLGVHLGLSHLLDIVLLAGGIGLLLLKEWGRWLVLGGCIALLILKAGTPLSHLRIPPYVLKLLVFYGVFIVVLCLPRARAVTQK
jgi:hypothetical protein